MPSLSAHSPRLANLLASLLLATSTLSIGPAIAKSIPPGVAGSIKDMREICVDIAKKDSTSARACCQDACYQNIPVMNEDGEVGVEFKVHQDWLDSCIDQCPKR